jgi:hypothetical protein
MSAKGPTWERIRNVAGIKAFSSQQPRETANLTVMQNMKPRTLGPTASRRGYGSRLGANAVMFVYFFFGCWRWFLFFSSWWRFRSFCSLFPSGLVRFITWIYACTSFIYFMIEWTKYSCGNCHVLDFVSQWAKLNSSCIVPCILINGDHRLAQCSQAITQTTTKKVQVLRRGLLPRELLCNSPGSSRPMSY